MTSLFYRILYRIGLTPWEEMASLPIAEQVSALFDRAEEGREPPYGAALDVGCGSGIWSVRLVQRGWDVTGIDVVPRALRRARERARQAGVSVRLVEADVTALRQADVGDGFRLIVDFGTVHGLRPKQQVAVGREVSAVASIGATLLMLAFTPGHRGPLPRGMSRSEIEATYPGWTVVEELPQDLRGAPAVVRRARPSWYRLRRG